MEMKQVKELLLQSLEHEMGGIKVYETAIKCAQNEDLKEEWEKYHEETEHHVEVLHDVFSVMGLDTEEQSPGRQDRARHGRGAGRRDGSGAGGRRPGGGAARRRRVRHHRRDQGPPQLGADRPGGEEAVGAEAKALKEAYDEVEDQEDEHLYHSRGWMRELWMESLGLKAVLPPPEERKHVKTAIGAARAEQERGKMR